MLSSTAFANTEMAKNVLSGSTTNAFCSAGFNGPNPYERAAYEQPDPSKSICEGQGDVVDCYRKMYNRSNRSK